MDLPLKAFRPILDARWYLEFRQYLDDTIEITRHYRDDDGERCKRTYVINEDLARVAVSVTIYFDGIAQTYKVRNPRHIFDYR